MPLSYLVVRNEEDIVSVVSEVPDDVDPQQLAESLVPKFTSAYRMRTRPNFSDIRSYESVSLSKFKVSIVPSETGAIVSMTIDGRIRRFSEADFRKLVGSLSEAVKKLDELRERNSGT